MKKYLPSKKFTIIACISLGILIITLILLNRKDDKGQTLMAEIITGPEETASINSLIAQDTDGDGIPDWEEALWGTDPNKKATNGDISDADWIAQKKKDLAIKEGVDSTPISPENLTETDKFSREFFVTVTALKQSGSLDQSAVSNISNVVGDRINNVTLPPNYTIIDLKKTYDVTSDSQAKYYAAVQDAFNKYKDQGLGSEFDSIDPAAETADAPGLIKIAASYQAFAEEIKSLPVPSNLTSNALDIANSAYNTGEAVKNLSKMETDPLTGLIGLSQYQKWSEEFINSSEELRTYLIDGGIIKG